MDTRRMKIVSDWLHNTVFSDEPINTAPARKSIAKLPPAIRAARALENTAGMGESWKAIFYKQARMLAKYEDDYEYPCGTTRYYPTYQSLTDEELRGYFTWRTKVRQGCLRKTSRTFVFLYIYELLNQIGVNDPMDGYHKLMDFWNGYSGIDDYAVEYLARWVADYIIYYGLDAALFENTARLEIDRCLTVLEQVGQREGAEVMRAVKVLAPRWLGRSRFYTEHSAEMDTVIVRVLRRMSEHYAARCKKTMTEQFFGDEGKMQVRLFESAVFCDPLKRRNMKYVVDDQRVYCCENGVWWLYERHCRPGGGKKLNALMKTIDSMMRAKTGYKTQIKSELGTRWVLRLIEEEIQTLQEERQAAEEKKVTIDFSQLNRIRKDAAITREKLIVEEEAPEPEATEEAPAPREASEEPAAAFPFPQEAPGGTPALSAAERRLLQCLLYGGGLGWVQAEGHMLSVLVDGINEKFYDIIGDTVVDDTPQAIDDYIEDLKEMVSP